MIRVRVTVTTDTAGDVEVERSSQTARLAGDRATDVRQMIQDTTDQVLLAYPKPETP
jgi:hypothetical protein